MADQTLRIACGPQTLEWSIADPAVARDAAARWHQFLTDRPADLTVTVQPDSAVANGRPPWVYWPVDVVGDAQATAIQIRFGNVARVDWQTASRVMVMVYKSDLLPAHVSLLLVDVVYRGVLAAWLPSQDGLLLHACGIMTESAVDLFVGPSAVGKSTVAQSVTSERVLHDDAILMLRREDRCWIYPAPWYHGSPADPIPGHQPVGRVFLLDREGASGIRRVPAYEALSFLLNRGLYGAHRVARLYQQQLVVLGTFVERHPCYWLRYRLGEEDPWRLIATAMAPTDTQSQPLTTTRA